MSQLAANQTWSKLKDKQNDKRTLCKVARLPTYIHAVQGDLRAAVLWINKDSDNVLLRTMIQSSKLLMLLSCLLLLRPMTGANQQCTSLSYTFVTHNVIARVERKKLSACVAVAFRRPARRQEISARIRGDLVATACWAKSGGRDSQGTARKPRAIVRTCAATTFWHLRTVWKQVDRIGSRSFLLGSAVVRFSARIFSGPYYCCFFSSHGI